MIIRKQCSGCMDRFTLDTVALTVTMRVPSNGRRGSLHVPAHTVTAEAAVFGEMIEWQCPRCDYSESEYADDEVRAALT